jgi:DNA polymerase-3 subunit gamma/tau
VSRGSSEEALRLLDRFMTEGHNPAFFAKQLVRFLRNTLVAKVSTAQSPVLQVSSDERARLGRVAEQFSEEDLARFLQIMLRTHDDVGYRQEQRFHLELGVLKMVHAQRLLPLEQLLSQMGTATAARASGAPAPRTAAPSAPSPGFGSARPPAGPSASSSASGPASAPAAPRVAERTASPFEADRARKSHLPEPEMSAAGTPQIESKIESHIELKIESSAKAEMETQSVATAVAEPPPAGALDAGHILGCVITDLEKAGHKMVASTLEEGSVELLGNELRVTVSQSKGVIELLMQAEQKRVANAAASRAMGSPVKVEVVSGKPANGTANGVPVKARAVREPGGARSRAANEPVVQRMREKFGAEIRTVIDHQEKN